MNPSGRNDLPKAIALVQITRFFDSGGCTDVTWLAAEYGCHPRTIQRWLADIDAYIMPLAWRGPNVRKWEA